jgi:hypothetical protein
MIVGRHSKSVSIFVILYKVREKSQKIQSLHVITFFVYRMFQLKTQ